MTRVPRDRYAVGERLWIQPRSRDQRVSRPLVSVVVTKPTGVAPEPRLIEVEYRTEVESASTRPWHIAASN